MNPLRCRNCRFFQLDETQTASEVFKDWEEMKEGECRAEPPRLGEMLTDRDGETFRHFGQWPRVMAIDWCGRFDPRRPDSRHGRALTPHVGTCSRSACASGHDRPGRQPCDQAAKCRAGQGRKDGE
jgi:hypothetical protein